MENTSTNNTDIIASTHLGKKISGSEIYDPSLLVVIPRIENIFLLKALMFGMHMNFLQ